MSVLMFSLLFGFWMIIIESLHWDGLLVGFAVCTLVVWFNNDILVKKNEFPPLTLRRIKILVMHAGFMLVEIVKANIQVVQIVLSPTLKFNQGLVIFTPKLQYEWNEVLFANSITLTPGTLTLEIDHDTYTVHVLDMSKADSLVSWKIQDNLRALEDER